MSAPTVNGHRAPAPAPDVLSVLGRADRRWCQRTSDDLADPDYLRHLADALGPVAEVDAGQHDSAEADELRTERDQLLDHLRQARADLDSLRVECAALAEANEELTHHVADAQRAAQAHEQVVLAAAADRDQLADQLAAARDTIASHEKSVIAALAERDRLLAKLAAATAHHCRWELDITQQRYLDCECGRPWPRYYLDDTEPVVPDVEPIEVLFGRLRKQLAGWGKRSA